MTIKKRILSLPFCLLFFITKSYSQSSPQVPDEGVTINKVIPAAADAASLGKYGSIPVSPYTGVPNISIPLYTIKSGDLTLPVSLSYHSGGFKVDEMASSVGLGWSLNAGGVITRTQRGLPDEDLNGFITSGRATTTDSLLRNQLTLNSTQQDQLNFLLNGIADGTNDGEPDIFNYNFGNYSGKFIIDSHRNFYVIPYQNIQFTVTITNGQTTDITAFTAKTPDGVTYYFGTSAATEYTNSTANKRQIAMSWYLYKIVSPSLHEIDFTYGPESYSQLQAPTHTIYNFLGFVTAIQPTNPIAAPPNNFSQGTSLVFNTVKLQNISFENGNVVVFSNATSYRNDLNPSHIPGKATPIDSIRVNNNNSSFSKMFKFYYLNTSTNRLRLDSLIQQLEPIAGTGKFKKEKYSFYYNPDPWTPVTTNNNFLLAQDWWGYYNGRVGSYYGTPTLIPQMLGYYNPTYGVTLDLPGANRATDESPMLGGILNKIVYPTGGYTLFNFEAHDEYNVDLQGTSSSRYPKTNFTTAFSNDPNSVYYNYDTNNGNPTHLLTVNAVGNDYIPIHFTAYGLGSAAPPPSPPYPLQDKVSARLYQKDGSGNYSILTYSFNSTDTTLNLHAGAYQIVLNDPSGQTDSTQFTYWIRYAISASWAGYTASQIAAMNGNFIVGGLRIQQIADYDGLSTNPINLKMYRYKQVNSTESSGFLDYQPVYAYELDIEKFGTGVPSIPSVAAFLTRTSFSNYPLTTTQGSVVGYSHVEELLGVNGKYGKNEYFYTNTLTNPDIQSSSGNAFPFAPSVSQDWRRGLLLKQTSWRNTGSGTFSKVTEKATAYGSVKSAFKSFALKAGFNPKPDNYSQSSPYYVLPPSTTSYGRLIETTYHDKTDFTYPASDTTRIYDQLDPTKFTQTVNKYRFDTTTYQLNQLQTVNSQNERITQTITYPNDYNAFGSTGVAGLLNNGIYTYPIEEVTQKSDTSGNNLRTIKAVYSTYKTTGPFRDSVYEMRSVAGVTNFVMSTAGPKDSHYQPVVSFSKYDTYGNILQERKVGDAYHTYVWGYNSTTYPYNNTYPVAEVINADTANIAYTNFEQLRNVGTTWGYWTFPYAAITTDATAPMGTSCYTVSTTNKLVRNGLSSANSYVVSFWSKSGAAITVTGGTVTNVATGNAKSGWIYHEYKVTGTTTVTVGGTGLIDEVRLYPTTAQMSTYSYVPLVGIATKCDVKNDITYYLYDNVGRLIQILDQNRNIVKDYQYNYATQGPIWTDTGLTQCETNFNGNTGYQDKQQTDTNPYSSTYGQTRWVQIGQNLTACPLPPPPIYVKLKLYSTYTSGDTFNTYEADAYSDAACTIPYNVPSNLTVNFIVTISNTTAGTVTNCPQSVVITSGTNHALTGAIDVTGCITCGGAGGAAMQSAQAAASPQVGGGGGSGCSSTVRLTTGTGYTPEY